MRHDALIIWGHGLHDLDRVLDLVRAMPGFTIRRILIRDIDDMPRFVRSVYNFDYAPYRHLIDKTRYLMSVPPKAAFIFLDNLDPKEHEVGIGRFKHIECQRITALKQAIREQFNPKTDGKPSEHHIVHATDHVGQTHAILDLLGYKSIAELQTNEQGVIQAPSHLPPVKRWTLKQIPIQSVYARINLFKQHRVETATNSHMLLPLAQTPHAMMLDNDPQAYAEYWQEHCGTRLTDDHAPQAFANLAERFDYLGEDYPDSYILLEPLDGERYVLLDGVHRASILRSRGEQTFIGAVAA